MAALFSLCFVGTASYFPAMRNPGRWCNRLYFLCDLEQLPYRLEPFGSFFLESRKNTFRLASGVTASGIFTDGRSFTPHWRVDVFFRNFRLIVLSTAMLFNVGVSTLYGQWTIAGNPWEVPGGGFYDANDYRRTAVTSTGKGKIGATPSDFSPRIARFAVQVLPRPTRSSRPTGCFARVGESQSLAMASLVQCAVAIIGHRPNHAEPRENKRRPKILKTMTVPRRIFQQALAALRKMA